MRFILPFLFSLNAWSATIVTETVGQVSDYVVTSREVQIAMVIENVLFPPQKSLVKGLYEIRPGHPDFRNAVTTVLLEVVVALEAENFNVATVSQDEIKNAMAKVEKAVAGRAYWAALEVSPEEVQKMTSRKLIAKSFWKFKSSSMTGIVSDQEAQSYFEKNRAKFGAMSFETFKENIKTFLAQQQLEDRIRAWFEVIKRKYKVRNFVTN